MADFIIVPTVDHAANPDDMSNAIFAFGAPSPAMVPGLTNGTAYRAYQVVRSDVSAEFTPEGVTTGTTLWEFDFDGADDPSNLLNGRNIFDSGSTGLSPSFNAFTPTTNGTIGAMAFNGGTGTSERTASFDMTNAVVGTSYTIRAAWAMNNVSASKAADAIIEWQDDAGNNLGVIWQALAFSTAADTYMLDGEVSSTMPVGATCIRLRTRPLGAEDWSGFNMPLFYICCIGQDINS